MFHSWQSRGFRHQRSEVRIQTEAIFCNEILLNVLKRRNKEKESGALVEWLKETHNL